MSKRRDDRCYLTRLTDAAVDRSYDTLLACSACGGPVNASLEVERGILDVLTRLALSPAWDDAKSPRLERVVTRLVQEYAERIQLRVTREPLSERPMETTTRVHPKPVPKRRTTT